jgi:hypothetical protein
LKIHFDSKTERQIRASTTVDPFGMATRKAEAKGKFKMRGLFEALRMTHVWIAYFCVIDPSCPTSKLAGTPIPFGRDGWAPEMWTG